MPHRVPCYCFRLSRAAAARGSAAPPSDKPASLAASRRRTPPPCPARSRRTRARGLGKAGESPADAEDDAAGDEPRIDVASLRQLQRAAQEAAAASARETESEKADQHRAAHDQSERRIPVAGDIEKADDLAGIRHARKDEADAEHEPGEECSERARRQARDAAHAMAAGAARAVARADADGETRDDQRGEAGFDPRRRQGGNEPHHRRRHEKPADESEAPADLARTGRDQTAEDAAHASDASGQEHEYRGRKADQESARKRRPRSEVPPVEGHDFNISRTTGR